MVLFKPNKMVEKRDYSGLEKVLINNSQDFETRKNAFTYLENFNYTPKNTKELTFFLFL
jgi:hypothetical protein